MLDIRYITENPAIVVKKLKERLVANAPQLVDALIATNEERKRTQTAADHLAQELNAANKKMASLFKSNPDEAARERERLSVVKEKHKKLVATLAATEEQLREQLLKVPNLPYDSVVVGTAENNRVVGTWRPESTATESTLLPHWELAKQYGLIDFELGNKITGAGFPVYQNKGAQLQRSLINFFLDQATCAGYQEVQPPLLVNEKSAIGTGQLPDKEGMMYSLQEHPFYLIPTAEVPITNLYREQILAVEELPIKHTAYTPCFRREAGSWGSHVRGLNRLHQFDKVELVEIHQPKNARKALDEMVEYVARLLRKLQLPYRILQLATGDLGFTSAITYDLEVWSVGQKKWLEVSSVSCFDSYQARRMQMRYRENDKIHYCHTINGSALALPRVMAALLEHGQTASSIIIPPVLATYTGWDAIH